MSANNKSRCPICKSDNVTQIERVRRFRPDGKVVPVTLHKSQCQECGTEYTSGHQLKANMQSLADRKQHYGKVLMGEEILRFRKSYGLSQAQASAIFGLGKIAFSRYENEKSYPEESTRKFLELAMESEEVLFILASKAGVDLIRHEVTDSTLESEEFSKARYHSITLEYPPSVQRSRVLDWSKNVRKTTKLEFMSANDSVYGRKLEVAC